MTNVRRAQRADRDPLLELWERSVRATHHFLADRDVVALRPFVAEELSSDAVDWWVLESTTGALMGFLGYARDSIEGLFIDPDYRHQGGGRALVAHAEALSAGPLAVDVNEQNDAALRFYTALGFTVVGRSATDGGGRPFPILHMTRPAPASLPAPNARTPNPCAHIAEYEIALAEPRDLPLIPSIELAAAQLLRGHAPETVLAQVTSERRLLDAQRGGRLWVARAGAAAVGFAHVERIEPNAVHLEELDVHPGHGRRGLGTRLVKAVCEWAQAHGQLAVTLATFREVPWNMPFYSRLGFEEIPKAELSPALRSVVEDETRRGLDPTRRVVMRRLPSKHAEVMSIRDEAEIEALAAFLVDRIYEFNAKATGYFDGMLLAGCVRSDTGEIIAGFNGHTWGGCCELANVWVHEQHRGQGLGALLLRSAEAEAVARGCVQVVLATHSFQAPGFYERMGYERKYTIEGRPQGHADIIYVKVLQRQTPPTR